VPPGIEPLSPKLAGYRGSQRGDDRNRTGVDGFAVRPKMQFLAYLSGFQGSRVFSGALVKRSVWESLGRGAAVLPPWREHGQCRPLPPANDVPREDAMG